MFRSVRIVSLILFILTLAVLPAAAQDGDFDVVVGNLVNPRGITFDSAGNLWVAEAGNGGPYMTSDDTPFGASSQITMVAPDGTASVVVHGLISYRQGNSLGAHALHITDDSIWMLLGEESKDYNIPFTSALVELDKETARVKTFVDLLTIELEQDPDGNPNGEANPVDLAVTADGTVLIAAAGCNCLMSWTPAAGVQIAASWPHATDNPVPTSVEVDGAGNIYVGFLTGFPWPQGGARIEKWSNGQLVETYPGLTAVTGMKVTEDGTIYAVELGVFTQGQGWAPGRVVKVSSEGITPVMEGLPAPYGIAMNADGELFVSINAIGGQGGAVIRVPMGM